MPHLPGRWGYTGDDFAVKSGSQITAIARMIDRVGSGGPTLATPTSVRVTNVTDSSVALAWTAVPGADGYSVARDGTVVTPFPVAATTYTNTDLPSGTSFVFTVRAVTVAGAVSAPSAPVAAATTGTPPPVGIPTGLAVTATTETTIALAWTPVAGASGYVVARDGASVGNVTAAAFTDTGLAPSTSYTYVVRALDGTGAAGPPSAGLVTATREPWPCESFRDNNVAHVYAGRAYHQTGFAYALGSNEYMGVWNVFFSSTLAQTGPEYYIVGSCP